MTEIKADPLREALEPFAAVANFISLQSPDDHQLLPQYGLTIRHFRAALAALAAPQPPAQNAAERCATDAAYETLPPASCVTSETACADCTAENCAYIRGGFGRCTERARQACDALVAPVAAPLGGREEVAAFLFARDEALILEGVTPDLLQWGRSQVRLGKNAVHSGDCTNECYSCARCAYDFAVRDAAAILAAVTPTAPVSDRAAALQSLEYWCTDERSKIGAVDGYDYRSGEEYGIRKVEIEIGKRIRTLAAKGDAK